jgi:hypothetical protein
MDGTENTIMDTAEQIVETPSPSLDDSAALTNEPDTGTEGAEITETEAQPSTQQDAEINRRNAAARRRAEQERRYADMQAEADRRVRDAERNAVIAATGGKTNPYTGKLIESVEELNAFNAAFAADNSRQKLQQAGIDPKDLEAIINQHPAVRQAQAADAANRQQMRQRLIEKDIADIGKIDPSIKSLEDLMDSPAGADTEKLVKQRGLSYLEAYKLVTFDRVSNARVAAQEKANAEKAGGKSHLDSTAQKTPDVVSVPSETMQMYRNAGFTEKEAREKYAQYLNSKKKG